MANISRRNELSFNSQAGMDVASAIIDLVHIKLGEKAFLEVIHCPMNELDEFFWKYLKFVMNTDTGDFVGQLTAIKGMLEQLPDHADMLKHGRSH